LVKSNKPAASKSIVVTVADGALKEIRKVADQLSAKGMNVTRVLPMTGVIAGSSASTKVASLRKVAGVASVEEEVVAELPPSDSKLQ
jgi:hypothetical protein